MTLYVASIVEGQTEANVVHDLLRRIWSSISTTIRIHCCGEPVKTKRDSFLNCTDEFDGKLAVARKRIIEHAAHDQNRICVLFVIVDSERNCPKLLAEKLNPLFLKLPTLNSSNPSFVGKDRILVCPIIEFENWIVAGASTLANINGLPDVIPDRHDVEKLKGSNWLDREIRKVNRNRKYRKTTDPLEFVRNMDIDEAKEKSPSFARLCKKLEELHSLIINTVQAEPEADLPESDTAD